MSQNYDLAIVNGTLVGANRMFKATAAVTDGRIAAFLGTEEAFSAERVIDAKGLHVLPGVIDPHVHTRYPGVDARETFESGTAAAAASG